MENAPYYNKVVYEDDKCKLYFDGDTPTLLYKEQKYTFGCHPYEPMAIIMLGDKAVSYIHNAFDPNSECEWLLDSPEHTVNTITGQHHDAQHFCYLLVASIDHYYDAQIDEVEKHVSSSTKTNNP